MALMELALIGPVVLLAIAALFEFGYTYLAQQLVQSATEVAARAMQTGAAQQTAVATGSTAAQTFVTSSLCPALLILPCGISNPLVNVQAVPSGGNFFSLAGFSLPTTTSGGATSVNTGALAYCNGQPGQLMQINVVYMAPVVLGFLWPNAINYNGSMSIPIYAGAAFADEKFPLAGTEASSC